MLKRVAFLEGAVKPGREAALSQGGPHSVRALPDIEKLEDAAGVIFHP